MIKLFTLSVFILLISLTSHASENFEYETQDYHFLQTPNSNPSCLPKNCIRDQLLSKTKTSDFDWSKFVVSAGDGMEQALLRNKIILHLTNVGSKVNAAANATRKSNNGFKTIYAVFSTFFVENVKGAYSFCKDQLDCILKLKDPKNLDEAIRLTIQNINRALIDFRCMKDIYPFLTSAAKANLLGEAAGALYIDGLTFAVESATTAKFNLKVKAKNSTDSIHEIYSLIEDSKTLGIAMNDYNQRAINYLLKNTPECSNY